MASLLTAANWPIVGQICWLLGKVMNFIYTVLIDTFHMEHGVVGWSIIIYTIIVYTCMIPMTVKQQRTSKMSSVMNPEIQAIQKKYRGKSDQASMLKQQEEIQQVYDKYGTSMMGGCLPLLIQMPFLFALYPVIYNMEAYVPALKSAPEAVQRFLTIPNMQEAPLQMLKNAGSYDLPTAVIVITCILLPVLSGATQMLNIRLSQAASGQQFDKDDPMAGTMKTMNTTMPLLSVFMVFTLPAGIGIYWVVSALVRTIQQLAINKHLEKMSVEDIIEKNREKAEAKAKKRGEKAEQINAMAQTNTRSIKTSANRQSSMSEKERELKLEQARKNAKPGSLADKANMVNRYNKSDK